MKFEILLQIQFFPKYALTMSDCALTNSNLHIPHCLFNLLPLHMYIKSCLRQIPSPMSELLPSKVEDHG